VGPIVVFLVLVLLGPLAFAGIAAWRFRHRVPGQRWGWERVVFAALVWVLVTVLAWLPLGLFVFIMAHRPEGTNPWTSAPILLLGLPLYAGAEFLVCRWAARRDTSVHRELSGAHDD